MPWPDQMELVQKRPDNIILFDRFDDASRGPWGSLWLLISLRTCHWVAIGAITTIVLLGFEPFLQAIVSFSGQMDPSVDSLKIHLGRSVALDIGLYSGDASMLQFARLTPSNQIVDLDPYTFLPDLGIVSSFIDGFYNSSNSSRQNASFICPTANCTWPTFTSLAVCSACNDVSSHLRRSNEIGSNLGTLGLSYAAMVGNYTSYSLPRVNITNMGNITVTKNESLVGTQILYSMYAYMAAATLTDPQSTLSFRQLNTMITAVEILKADAGYEAGVLTWDQTPISATECALYFCTNAYESIVHKGILMENIVASWAERDIASYRGNGDDYDAYDKWNNYSLYSAGGDFPRSDLQLFIPKEDLKKYGLSKERFNLTQNTVGSTVRYANEQLLGSSITWPPNMYTVSAPVAQALYKSENLSITFDKVAWSVSNWMRDISDVANTGVGQEWVIHIHVKWTYMILPLLVMSLGLLFCIWTMLDTRRLHLESWKTSMIATLTHSVDAETRAQLRHAERNGYLEKAVKEMTVTFEDAGCGLELKPKMD